MPTWLSREEAVAALGVRAQTLYAYVSRGLVAARPDPGQSGRSQYLASDIAGLVQQKTRGRGRGKIAASTMAWGEPIIATEISTIQHGALIYRGRNAMELSRAATLEDAAALLWAAPDLPRLAADAPLAGHAAGRARAYAALGLEAARAVPSPTLGRPRLQTEAARIVGLLAGNLCDMPEGPAPLHLRLAGGWGCADDAGLIRRALVLLADQELTTSAFAARVTASTGAPLAAAALAGLAALSGPLHGDATAQVARLMDDAARLGPEAAVGQWMASGQTLPGFGHKLYPEGDPRAAELLCWFEPAGPVRQLIITAGDMTGLPPNLDVVLAALTVHLALPRDAAFHLFAIARAVGWMAHAMEQITTGTLIRPRARYTGPDAAAGTGTRA